MSIYPKFLINKVKYLTFIFKLNDNQNEKYMLKIIKEICREIKKLNNLLTYKKLNKMKILLSEKI